MEDWMSKKKMGTSVPLVSEQVLTQSLKGTGRTTRHGVDIPLIRYM
jgi:hypothetical protein